MASISYAIGDATAPVGQGRRIVCHVVNDIGRWGKGFVVAVSAQWPEPEAAYRHWHAGRGGNDFALGAVQLVAVGDDLWVANVVGQHGIASRRQAGGGREPPVRYDAIEAGLSRLAVEANRLAATVHMPRIGCGLAGGRWELVEPIVQRTLVAGGVGVTVYDLSKSTP
jgi:O-acetyl-ADP-ribose deacetylase (regulator of RNase III)